MIIRADFDTSWSLRKKIKKTKINQKKRRKKKLSFKFILFIYPFVYLTI